MKRLLYIITRAEPGGAQVHLLELLRSFRDRFELHVGVGEEGFLTEEARRIGVRVHMLPSLVHSLDPRRDWAAVGEARRLIRSLQPHLIHLHSSKAGMVGRLAARLEGAPAVFTAHGWAFTNGVSWQRKAVAIPSEALAARLGGEIITVSRYDYSLALRYRVASPQKMVVIHNGLPDAPYQASPASDGVVRIVMVARFAAPKDHGLLLQALAGLGGLRWEVELIGDGPLQPFAEEQAARLGIGDRVRFVGARNDVAERLARAHIFVLASNYEGFPLSILEAMRAGLPVVASNVGGVAEAVTDGETGFLVPRGDLQALRGRLAQLIENPQLRAQMGVAGRARYKAHFTLEQMLEKTLAVYEKALKTKVC
ncbi:glycosyltransferase family 4 protein [Meiothermus taiwanensis]|nr:glycosyltransferase family 4 protein [Meiothermus taiwanensis]